MPASSRPESRSQHHAYLPFRALLPISAATRAGAQAADTTMTQEKWEYFPPAVTVEIQPRADYQYIPH